jgi:hypothetical protein
MITIANFAKPEDAHLLRMRLDAGGIESFLVDETVTQMEWAFFTGGVRVQVADEDVESVRALMASQDADAAAADEV